jgi:hypothetical protein
MTIAAGYLTREGALLFTDSQFSGWEKTNKEKIFIQTFPGDLLVAFALAGHEDYGRTIVEDSFEAISDLTLKQRTISAARKAIRGVLKRLMKEFTEAGLDSQAKPQFIVALSSTATEGIKLFSTSETAMPPVSHWEFRGTGAYLASFIQKTFGRDHVLSMRQTALVALHILATTKRHDAAVGGSGQFLAIRGVSAISTRGGPLVDLKETAHIDQLEDMFSALLPVISDPGSTNESVEAALEEFSGGIRGVRLGICSAGSRVCSILDSIAPAEPPSPQ